MRGRSVRRRARWSGGGGVLVPGPRSFSRSSGRRRPRRSERVAAEGLQVDAGTEQFRSTAARRRSNSEMAARSSPMRAASQRARCTIVSAGPSREGQAVVRSHVRMGRLYELSVTG
jgi:hypothetical protein